MNVSKKGKSVSNQRAVTAYLRMPSSTSILDCLSLVKPDRTLRCGCQFHSLDNGLRLRYVCKKHESLLQ